jgi:hypothetical protein
VFDEINRVETLMISGVNLVNLDTILDIIAEKALGIIKIVYIPTVLEICVDNLKKLFAQVLRRDSGVISYMDLVIDFRLNLVDDNIVFDNFVGLLNVIEDVLRQGKVDLLRMNHKIIRLNSNWKNEIYYHFLF